MCKFMCIKQVDGLTINKIGYWISTNISVIIYIALKNESIGYSKHNIKLVIVKKIFKVLLVLNK